MSLDIATKTGWALQRDGTEPLYGLKVLPQETGEFALEFERWLVGMIEAHRVGRVVVEAPIPARTKTNAIVLMRAYGAHVIARKVCLSSGIPIESVTPDRWRLFFIGVSRAPKTLTAYQRRKWLKEAAMAKCKKLGWHPASDDVADALGLLAYAMGAGGVGHELGRESRVASSMDESIRVHSGRA